MSRGRESTRPLDVNSDATMSALNPLAASAVAASTAPVLQPQGWRNTPPLPFGAAAEVLGTRRVASLQDRFRVADGHAANRLDEELAGLRHRRFRGIDRLADMVSRASASATPAPETMRRLLHAILDHQDGELQDDATIVVVEWRGSGSQLLEL